LFVASIPAYVYIVFELGPADWMGSPVEAPAALVFTLGLLGVLASITTALICLTPDGRLVPRWTRWLILLSLPLVVSVFSLPLPVWGVYICLLVSGAIYAQVYRYRFVYTPTERQQTKWVMFGVLLWWLLILMLFVPYSIESSLSPGSPLPWWTLYSAGYWLTLAIVPLSLSIAVLRYRLYDIDIIINRTLVYGSLTVLLGLVYFGSVASLQYAFRALIGHEDFPQLTIVVSTLVIAALFDPLRRRIQAFIDRRFYRRKYDARKTLDDFSVRLRDETNLDSLNAELITVVKETKQPEHVSLWLRQETAAEGRQPH
jgi:hypothetical protein